MSRRPTEVAEVVRHAMGAAAAKISAREPRHETVREHVAANDHEGPVDCAGAGETGDVDLSPAQLARCIDRLSPGSIASIRAVEHGLLAPWRAWRRISLADGGWIRVVPIDLLAGDYLLQVAGPWADAATIAGMYALKSAQIAPTIQAHADAIDARRVACAGGDVHALLERLGLQASQWAAKFVLVDRTRGAVSVSVAQDLCATLWPDASAPGKLNLRFDAGPIVWAGRGFDPLEIDHTLTALKTAVHVRAHIDGVIQASRDRAHRLLHEGRARAAGDEEASAVLWVSQSTVSMVKPGLSRVYVSVPAMELPALLRGRMSRESPPMHGLEPLDPIAAWTAERPAEASYSVAVASLEGPWVARVGMDALANALAGSD
jgi:hypothetical protein